MKALIRFPATLLFSACLAVCLQAGTITTKTGEIITGELQGTLLLKSHVWQLKTESGHHGIVYYVLVEGADVQSLSHKSVMLKPYARFQVALVGWDIGGTEKPPTDVEVAKVAGSNKQMPMGWASFRGGVVGMFVNGNVTDKESDVYSIYRDVPSHLTGGTDALLAAPALDRLKGVYRKAEKGDGEIIPEVRVMTQSGERLVRTSEIYPPSPSKS
jgi:hypothetical protein